MKKFILVILFFPVAAAVALGWYLYPTVSPISVDRPITDTPTLEPLPPTSSTIVLPITIPLESLQDYVNKITPETKRGTHAVKVKGVRVGTIHWSFARTPISIVGKDEKLHLTGAVKGSARLGPLSLGLAANISASAQLRVESNWRATLPELQLQAPLSRAKLFRIISVRSMLQEPVNKEMRKFRNDIQTMIKKDTFLENAAKQGWGQLCNTFPLNKKASLWIEVKPLAIRTAQPIISDKSARLQFGLDANTRVVTSKTSPQCDLPKALVIEAPRPGILNLTLPAHANYGWLSGQLRQRIVSEIKVEGVYFHIKDVHLHPHGDFLLLAVDLTAKVDGWFGARGEGTIYIVARPALDLDSQTIVLKDLKLDTESRNLIVSVLGELVEPILLGFLRENSTIDLKPKFLEIKENSTKVFEAMSKGGFSVQGQVETVELDRIDIGRDNLRVHARLVASLSGEVRTIRIAQ